MLDNLTATRNPGVPPNPDTWTIVAKAGSNPQVSINLINVSNSQQFSQAVAKLFALLDAMANLSSGITIDATKLPL